MRSIFKILLSLVIIATVFVPGAAIVTDAVKTAVQTKFTYLIAGLDDAADNTDAIILLSYDSTENSAAVVQIPRDTYCNFGDRLNKVNHLYSSYRLSGLLPADAMKCTADFLAKQLGISIDGYFAITSEIFRNAVDAIGGVEVVLPEDFYYESSAEGYSFKLKAGKNILDGKMSEIFVRHRKGYALGDLGRIDAQKIFINGLYNTVFHSVDYEMLLRATKAIGKGAVTDFSLTELLIMMLRHSAKFRDVDITYVTMPGRALKDEQGIWYYVLNRKAAQEVICEFLFGDSVGFDAEKRFFNSEKAGFDAIYNSTDIEYKKYNSGNIADISITKNNSH